jgi:hypothetical protein
MGMSAKRWFSTNAALASEIREVDAIMYGAQATTVATLIGYGEKGARSRQAIYEKWGRMESDAIVSSALLTLVTAALGGHETSGNLVFIEATPRAKEDKQLAKIAEEISRDLAPLLNREAFSLAYIGAAFGDSYARIYADKRGVVDLYTGEMLRPQLVQPFERGNRTVGYAIYIGERNFERLDSSQTARLKMPRTQWVPQHGVVEKSMRVNITEDDPDNLPIMPSMAGGSLLFNAETSYDNLTASLLGLVGQRWMDSIDEQIMQVNLESMSTDQQEQFLDSVVTMLKKSKAQAEEAVANNRPIFEKIRHILPVFNEKQLTQAANLNGGQSGRSATISIDDVMVHARLLSGAIGVDLSMLGFADQMSGGLGEGGFFRTSAQVAERSRVIRQALAECFNHIIDIHTMNRYGVVFSPADRPWTVNFFGSISALESEAQRTKAEAMNGGMMLAQSIQLMKDMGADVKIMESFLTKQMMMDEDQAKLFANIVNAVPSEGEGGNDGGGGGGFPG